MAINPLVADGLPAAGGPAERVRSEASGQDPWPRRAAGPAQQDGLQQRAGDVRTAGQAQAGHSLQGEEGQSAASLILATGRRRPVSCFLNTNHWEKEVSQLGRGSEFWFLALKRLLPRGWSVLSKCVLR